MALPLYITKKEWDKYSIRTLNTHLRTNQFPLYILWDPLEKTPKKPYPIICYFWVLLFPPSLPKTPHVPWSYLIY